MKLLLKYWYSYSTLNFPFFFFPPVIYPRSIQHNFLSVKPNVLFLDLSLISKIAKLLFQDCKRNLPAPVQTGLLIFLDMVLSYLNNIFKGNSGLESDLESRINLLWPKVMIMVVAKAWSKVLFYILDHPLLTSNDLDKAQEHFSALSLSFCLSKLFL